MSNVESIVSFNNYIVYYIINKFLKLLRLSEKRLFFSLLDIYCHLPRIILYKSDVMVNFHYSVLIFS